MGYLVSASLVRSEADFGALSALPASIAWRVYRLPQQAGFIIDIFSADREQKWPFTSLPPMKDIPLELPAELDDLSRLYAGLAKVGLANTFKRGLINLNLELSRLLAQPVCSLASDDDILDFVCISNKGKLEKLRAHCADLELLRDAKGLFVQPFKPEHKADVESLTDLEVLAATASDATIKPRDKAWVPRLHRVAIEEATAFLGTKDAPIGLGTFDPEDIELETVAASSSRVAQSAANAPQPAPVAVVGQQGASHGKRWWEFWKR